MAGRKGKNGDIYVTKYEKGRSREIILFSCSQAEEFDGREVKEIKIEPGDIVLRLSVESGEVAIIHPQYGYQWISRSNLLFLC